MKKKGLIVAGSILGVLGIAYVGVSVYFNSHYLPNTTINGLSCGYKTADYVEKTNQSQVSNYLLTITDRQGNNFPLSASDISYQYVSNGTEQKYLDDQNAFAWPLYLFAGKKNKYESKNTFTFDSEQLSSKLSSLDIFKEDYISEPQNAYINFKDGDYEVVADVPGNSPIMDQIVAEVTDALNSNSDNVTLSDDCYKNAEIPASDPKIEDATKKIEAYASSTIHYLIDDVDENLSRADIIDMINIGKDFSVSIDEDKIIGFVQRLASTYNTYGDVREFKTSSGDTVKIGGGDYGWVISKARETEQIKKDLQGGKAVERKPVYEQTAIQSGRDDIGNTYIEIDLGKQHLWYYVKGKLKDETDIVSGCLASHNGSVDGIYKISCKEKDKTLIGENYATPVKYFMPFAYNIGIHDANWRHGNFGGQIYRNSGSHGCINVPPAFAKRLFKVVETGTPVIAFYREKVELTNLAAQKSNAFSYVNKGKK